MQNIDLKSITEKYCNENLKDGKNGKCIDCENLVTSRSLICDLIQTDDIEKAEFRFCNYESLPEEMKYTHNINGQTTDVPMKIDCSDHDVCELDSLRFKDRVLDETIDWPWTKGNPSHNEKHTTFQNISEEECLCKCKQRGYDPDAKGHAENPCFGIQYEHEKRECKLISATTKYPEWQVFVKGPNNKYDGYRPGHLYQPQTNGMVPLPPVGCGSLENCIRKCNDDSECLYVFDGPDGVQMGGMMIRPGFDTIVLHRGELNLPAISPFVYNDERVKINHQKRMIEKCIGADGSIDSDCFNENT